jgi:hypothetical protein
MHMGLFDRFKRKGKQSSERSGGLQTPQPLRQEKLPDWAGHFTSVDDLHEFEMLVDAYFRKRGELVIVGDGAATRFEEDGKTQRNQYGLSKLSRVCLMHEKWEWAGMVASHFDTLERASRLNDDAQTRMRDYVWCESRLVTRMAMLDDPAILETLVHRVDFAGTVTYVAVDMGESFMSVRPDLTAEWPGGPDAWFAAAEKNARRLAPAEVHRQELDGGLTLHLIRSEGHSHAWARAIDEFPEILGAFGAIVSIPTATTILSMPVDGFDVVERMQAFFAITAGLERDGPESISPVVYWLKDGRWHAFEMTAEADGVRVTPPAEFVALLDSLAEGMDGPSGG